MKRVTIILILTIASLSIWGQGGGYGSGTGYPSTSLIAQGVVTYYRTTTQGGNAPKWYDINATGTAYVSRDSVNTAKLDKTSYLTDTATLLAKRDTGVLANGIRNSISTTAGVPISQILPFGTLTVSTAALSQTITKDAICPTFNSSSGYELSRFQLYLGSGGTVKYQHYGVDYTVTVNTNSITVLGISGYSVSDKLYFRFQ